jgi:hypothetical protein
MLDMLMLRSPHGNRFLRSHRPNDLLSCRFGSTEGIQLGRIDTKSPILFYQVGAVVEVPGQIG